MNEKTKAEIRDHLNKMENLLRSELAPQPIFSSDLVNLFSAVEREKRAILKLLENEK